ncbi:MAG: hypothetical protein QF541_11890 [Lentisphaeria bacterium]|jgi:hypothetical protein|nr:hypothetical protein [Lentisphaeria bacterium]|tara:strand:+ start:83 stop:559 length:477 start_codon:yes stop_codon:yes gene_type:complete
MVIHDLFQVRSAGRDVPGNEPEMIGEPAGIWEPPSRNEIGFGRYKNEAIMISYDRGYNWTIPTLVTRRHELSGDLALLPDGRLVMTYDQKDGVSGSRALVSNDMGGGNLRAVLGVQRPDQLGHTERRTCADVVGRHRHRDTRHDMAAGMRSSDRCLNN